MTLPAQQAKLECLIERALMTRDNLQEVKTIRARQLEISQRKKDKRTARSSTDPVGNTVIVQPGGVFIGPGGSLGSPPPPPAPTSTPPPTTTLGPQGPVEMATALGMMLNTATPEEREVLLRHMMSAGSQTNA